MDELWPEIASSDADRYDVCEQLASGTSERSRTDLVREAPYLVQRLVHLHRQKQNGVMYFNIDVDEKRFEGSLIAI